MGCNLMVELSTLEPWERWITLEENQALESLERWLFTRRDSRDSSCSIFSDQLNTVRDSKMIHGDLWTCQSRPTGNDFGPLRWLGGSHRYLFNFMRALKGFQNFQNVYGAADSCHSRLKTYMMITVAHALLWRPIAQKNIRGRGSGRRCQTHDGSWTVSIVRSMICSTFIGQQLIPEKHWIESDNQKFPVYTRWLPVKYGYVSPSPISPMIILRVWVWESDGHHAKVEYQCQKRLTGMPKMMAFGNNRGQSECPNC